MVGFSFAELDRQQVRAISASLEAHYGQEYPIKAYHCLRSNGHKSPAVRLVLGDELVQKLPAEQHAQLVQAWFKDFRRSVYDAAANALTRITEFAAIRLEQVPAFLPRFIERLRQIVSESPASKAFQAAVRAVAANVSAFWAYLEGLFSGPGESKSLSEEDLEDISKADQQSSYMTEVVKQLSRFVGYAQQVASGLLDVAKRLMSYLGNSVRTAIDGFHVMATSISELPDVIDPAVQNAKRAVVNTAFFLSQGISEIFDAWQSGAQDIQRRVDMYLTAMAREYKAVVVWLSKLSGVRAMFNLWDRILRVPLLGGLLKGIGYAVGKTVQLGAIVLALVGKFSWAIQMVLSQLTGLSVGRFLSDIMNTALPVMAKHLGRALQSVIPVSQLAQLGGGGANPFETKEILDQVTLAKQLGALPSERLAKDTRSRLREAAFAMEEAQQFVAETARAHQAQKSASGISVKQMYRSARRDAGIMTSMYYGEPVDLDLLDEASRERCGVNFREFHELAVQLTDNLTVQLQAALAELLSSASEKEAAGDLRYEEALQKLQAARERQQQQQGEPIEGRVPMAQRGTRRVGFQDERSPVPIPEVPTLEELWMQVRKNRSVPTTVVGLRKAADELSDELAQLKKDMENVSLPLAEMTLAASGINPESRKTSNTLQLMATQYRGAIAASAQDAASLSGRLSAVVKGKQDLRQALLDEAGKRRSAIARSTMKWAVGGMFAILVSVVAWYGIQAAVEYYASARQSSEEDRAARAWIMARDPFISRLVERYEIEKGGGLLEAADPAARDEFFGWCGTYSKTIAGHRRPGPLSRTTVPGIGDGTGAPLVDLGGGKTGVLVTMPPVAGSGVDTKVVAVDAFNSLGVLLPRDSESTKLYEKAAVEFSPEEYLVALSDDMDEHIKRFRAEIEPRTGAGASLDASLAATVQKAGSALGTVWSKTVAYMTNAGFEAESLKGLGSFQAASDIPALSGYATEFVINAMNTAFSVYSVLLLVALVLFAAVILLVNDVRSGEELTPEYITRKFTSIGKLLIAAVAPVVLGIIALAYRQDWLRMTFFMRIYSYFTWVVKSLLIAKALAAVGGAAVAVTAFVGVTGGVALAAVAALGTAYLALNRYGKTVPMAFGGVFGGMEVREVREIAKINAVQTRAAMDMIRSTAPPSSQGALRAPRQGKGEMETQRRVRAREAPFPPLAKGKPRRRFVKVND